MGVTLLTGTACVEQTAPPEPVQASRAALEGENLSGANLGGMNLGGMNLGGMNLGGPNLGGMNLGGMNLGGMNLGGMNLGGMNFGGNNLGGMNMSASNLGGMNLGGMNLGGMNLGGMNLSASNLSGSNTAGTNLGGMNLGGMNLGGMNLAGPTTGSNIHGLSVAIDGMLYSGEDLWQPKTAQCIVLGLGSTAFPRLLAQQTPGARMSVALGKLPWGFPASADGPLALEAWEAVVWGDQSYCTFVLLAQPGTTWAGVAGFVKAVFRWNAPPTQAMDISGIDASAAYDPTVNTGVITHTGMMDAAARYNGGVVDETRFVAGELGFATATTNNQGVLVDFASWTTDTGNNGLVLGNVESASPPTYAEGAYSVFSNGDGTYGVSIARLEAAGGTLIPAYNDLASSYTAYRSGQGPKPVPIRCGGALYLNLTYNEPIPSGKCDSGLGWAEPGSLYPSGMKAWSTVAGTTAPMNQFMYLPVGGSYPYPFLRAANRPIVSETYIHMWEPNHTLPASAVGGSTGTDRTSLGVAVSSAPGCTSSDDPSNAFNNISSLKWCATGTPTATAPRSIMYMWGAAIPITSYRITSAADLDTRDPRSWTFQGCPGTCTVGADAGWVTLDSRSGETFTSRLQSNSYSFANVNPYSQYRLRITANKGNVAYVQLREIQMFDSGGPVLPLAGVDRTEDGTVTWTGKACSTAELPTRAFDNLMSATGATRWCVSAVPTAARPVTLGYTWAAPAVVTSYRLTSAGDTPTRDPRDWLLQACDGTCKIGVDAGWVTLDTRTGETFPARFQTKSYTVASALGYPQVRLKITANNGDAAKVQVGELQIF
jgi:uncharacterized protein YjbI with pentapeptide repeats